MPRLDFPRPWRVLAAILVLGGAGLGFLPGVSQASGKEAAGKPYALIIGTVFSPENAPVYGIKIKVQKNQQKKAHWETYSNHQGEFAVRVPAGAADYVVSAEPPKKSAGGVEISVHIVNDERKDISLHLTPAVRIQ